MNFDFIFFHHLIFSLLAGFFLDCILGDPYFFPHPVRMIGKLVLLLEKFLLNAEDPFKVQKIKGGILVFIVLAIVFSASFSLLFVLKKNSPPMFLIFETIMCYQCIAAKCLCTESIKVYKNLKKNDLEKARKAVSMIVGRDTDILDEKGVERACVETVAESTNDGVVAPLFFIVFFGAVGGMVYKAINTMDSMIGYKDDKFLNFGFFAAKLDDAANFLPSRISGILLIICALVLPKFSGKNSLKIFLRDRKKHASPNSAQTESAVAGALGVRLAGDTVYGGVVEKKEFIGDEIREIESEDIVRADVLMYGATLLFIILFCIIYLVWAFK